MELAKPMTEFLNQTNEIKNDIGYDVNQRLDKTDQSPISPMREGYEPDRRLDSYYSTEAEREAYIPDENSELGEWKLGEKGNGLFVPNINNEKGETIANVLNEYGLKGIEYIKGIPVFNKCSEAIVAIDNMTENMSDNFNQADAQLAKQWNAENKNGRTDWVAQDIKDYRMENDKIWHDCSDMKTCMLIDRNIHDYFGHAGGTFECEKKNAPEQITPRNAELEGQTHPKTGVPFERKQVEVDGKQFEVVAPVFDSQFDVQLPEDMYKAKDREQFKECNAQLKKEIETNKELRDKFDDEQLDQIQHDETPDGYTWHHDVEAGKMQLVDTETHQKTGHTGGRSIWGGGTENR